MIVLLGILIPFLGTLLGSVTVFFLRKEIPTKFNKLLIGFAAGVMIAASIWSLLIPAINTSETEVKWMPSAIGFTLGMLSLLIIDSILPHQHLNEEEPEGVKTKLKKPWLLFFSITLHNLPEGMAVGALLSGFLTGDEAISLMGIVTLAVGIAIQNIPEGSIVAMPLKESGLSRPKAFLAGAISGVAEVLGTIIMILLGVYLEGWLPYVLSFAAGAMIYVVVEELIPQSQMGKHSNVATIGMLVGFLLMMILDIALG